MPATTIPTATNETRVIRFEPRGAGRELFYATDPDLLVAGPAGTGKTRCILEKIHLLLSNTPGMRACMVRKTLESLKSSGLVTYQEEVKPQYDGVVFFGGNRKDPPQFRYPNGSRFLIGGMDDPEKVLSTQYDLIYPQECTELTITDYETLSTRLRNGVLKKSDGEVYQQMLSDCNPGAPNHWLYKMWQDGKLRMLTSVHEDNPKYHDGHTWTAAGLQYLARLDRLSGVRKKRLRYGIWAAAEGMVFDEWDRATHVIKPFKIPQEWRRVRVVDFGFTNPFVCLWAAFDEDDRIYIYRELYKTREIVEDHAREIIRHTGAERIETTIADHDAEDRATLHRNGIRTVPAKKAITVGVLAVQDRLRVQDDGKPRLFVFENALCHQPDYALAESSRPTRLEQEIESYVWPMDNGKAIKEVPVGIDDHAMDALRYLCQYAKKTRRRVTPFSAERVPFWKSVA